MKERADDMAWFVINAGLSPLEYKELTLTERESLIEAIKAARG